MWAFSHGPSKVLRHPSFFSLSHFEFKKHLDYLKHGVCSGEMSGLD